MVARILFIMIFSASLLFAQGHPLDLERINLTDIETNEPLPDLFYETDGLVCMEAEHAQFEQGWKIMDGETGKSVKAERDGLGTAVPGFDILFTQSGDYAVRLLDRNDLDQAHHKGNRVLVAGDRSGGTASTLYFDGKPTFIDHGPYNEISFGTNDITGWSSGPDGKNQHRYRRIKTSGKHRLELLIHQEYGFTIDKIVLSLDNKQPPRGLGPVETVSATFQQPQPGADKDVILPPAWAFGVIYGYYAKQDSVLADVRRFIDEDYPIDAYWIDSWSWDWENRGPSGHLNFTGDRKTVPNPKAMRTELENNNIKAGIWIWHKILEDGREELFAEFRDKGYLKEIKDPDPNGRHNKPKLSAGGLFDFENPGCVELFREKTKPLFDDGQGFKEFDSPDMDDEYYARYTQFGCFCPVFEVFSSMTNPRHNYPFHMGKTAQNIYRYDAHWRMRLFPYIYTHAHLTRQTGQNMIHGDGVHLTQYRFGDAFLAAPVVERWARTRDVWLPENDRWSMTGRKKNLLADKPSPLPQDTVKAAVISKTGVYLIIPAAEDFIDFKKATLLI